MPVTVTSTVDLGDLGRRLADAERAVLVKYESAIMAMIKKRWRGWRYDGRPRGAPVNVSLAAWQSRIETTEGGRPRLFIENRARSYDTGDPYVSFVHKAGTVTPEVQLIRDELAASWVPRLRRDLAAAILAATTRPTGRKRLRGRGGGGTETMELDI